MSPGGWYLVSPTAAWYPYVTVGSALLRVCLNFQVSGLLFGLCRNDGHSLTRPRTTNRTRALSELVLLVCTLFLVFMCSLRRRRFASSIEFFGLSSALLLNRRLSFSWLHHGLVGLVLVFVQDP